MAIDSYFSEIKALLDRYAATTFVVSVNISFETRPGEQGFLVGSVEFTDGSRLYLREYLDAEGEIVEKIMYSYHFQDAEGKMVFRYDNAAHRPILSAAEHKHDSGGAHASLAPALENVLIEIVESNRWAR